MMALILPYCVVDTVMIIHTRTMHSGQEMYQNANALEYHMEYIFIPMRPISQWRKVEATHVLRLLRGHTPSYPVYLDMEDSSTGRRRKKDAGQYSKNFL